MFQIEIWEGERRAIGPAKYQKRNYKKKPNLPVLFGWGQHVME